MKKTEIVDGICYLEVPEENIRILCGCPENSIKFIMKMGLTPKVSINGFNLVSGPNAILLNDFSVVNSHFLNFSEFPFLHHQFFQGAAFNGTNEKFTLIGSRDRVADQYEYIRRGFQGLSTKSEILESGVPEDVAEKFWSLAIYHRGYEQEFNAVNPIYINGKTQIKGNLYIERVGNNIFNFYYKGEVINIDINLDRYSKGVGLPYKLDNKFIEFDKFSVTTVGDGNGWNPDVPCMGALINCEGKRFLVDSGPGSLDLIRKLGLTASDVEGVFVTHSHDDHFAGLLSLINSENKIKFFSSGLVIASVQKKFQALLNFQKDELKKYIDFIELRVDEWINIGEMEVKVCYSFHTVETNIFYFRVLGEDGEWKSYGHITDIMSRNDLDKIISKDTTGVIKKSWAYNWFDNYLHSVNLKRIDAGGGSVHGDSHDFVKDKSDKIILSHLDHSIDTTISKNFSGPTSFGHTEVLIKNNHNYLKIRAKELLDEVSILTGHEPIEVKDEEIILKEPGEVLYNVGDKLDHIYLVVSGLVTDKSNSEYSRKYIKGDFLYTFNKEKKSKRTFVTQTYCYLLKIDSKLFFNCLSIIGINKNFNVLRENKYFTYGISMVNLVKLSRVMERFKYKKDSKLEFGDFDYFFIVKGEVDVFLKGNLISRLKSDSLSGFDKNMKDLEFKINETTILLMFRKSDIDKHTSFLWSIFEESQKIQTIVETGFI